MDLKDTNDEKKVATDEEISTNQIYSNIGQIREAKSGY